MRKTISLISLALTHLSTTITGAEPLVLTKEYWQDESFLKSFNGSYRINARIEPHITSEERGLLVNVQAKMQQGNRENALKLLNSSSLTNNSAALLFNKGNIQFELGETAEAIQSYQKALKIYPSFRRAHQNLGTAFMREGNVEGAEQSLLKAVQLGDMNGSTLGLLGYCHLQKGRIASALQSYRLAQVTQPNTLEWKAGTAQCLLEMDNLKEALFLLRELTSEAPEQLSYQLLFVNTLLKSGNTTEALARLEWLRKRETLNISHLSLLAQLYLQEDLSHLASPLFAEIKKNLTPETLTPYLNCISNLLQLEEYNTALDLIGATSSLTLSDHDKLRVKRLHSISHFHLSKPGAITLLNESLVSNPLDGEILLLLAGHERNAGQYDLASMHYERAAQSPEHKYMALLEHGKMLVTQKKFSLAIEKLNAAVKITPSKELFSYIKAVESIAESWK